MMYRRTLIATLASLPLLGGVLHAQTPSTAVISCVTIVTGTVRIVPTASACLPLVERVVVLDQVGPAGPQGPAGPAGPTGAQGPAGAKGATGSQGPAGPTGATGAAGPVGATGATGAAGPAGAIGPAGPAGPTGAAGPAGATGAAGPAGATGAAGPAGATGAAGPAGPTGPIGATGLAGPQGPAGATGAGGGQVWSANLNVPSNLAFSGILAGQAAGLGSYVSYSTAGVQQVELLVPNSCIVSNFTAVQNGASGTSSAQINLNGFGVFQNSTSNPTYPASCTLVANNGGTSSCTVSTQQGFLAAGSVAVVTLQVNGGGDLSNFANARIQTSFNCSPLN